jgi:hypothetical protein
LHSDYRFGSLSFCEDTNSREWGLYSLNLKADVLKISMFNG